MIVFDLKCGADHRFEAWFKDSDSFTAQAASGEIGCPVCGDDRIVKAMMAPRLNIRSHGREPSRPDPDANADAGRDVMATGGEVPAAPAATPDPATARLMAVQGEVMKRLREIRREVEASCDFVGDRFAEEARSMHLGETEARPIYGQTTEEEAESLREDGIPFAAVPWLPRDDG
ncbi:DUF1178 family protein [Tistrella bauzanensis]|uniref:DUF1178 family protein n=1 Tax=Tistrella arctica TaxID=3133430 RepID=A0ABU9YFD5_9PROT